MGAEQCALNVHLKTVRDWCLLSIQLDAPTYGCLYYDYSSDMIESPAQNRFGYLALGDGRSRSYIGVDQHGRSGSNRDDSGASDALLPPAVHLLKALVQIGPGRPEHPGAHPVAAASESDVASLRHTGFLPCIVGTAPNRRGCAELPNGLRVGGANGNDR